jgi:hypothetical protein
MADLPDPNPIIASMPWGGDFILTDNGSIEFVSGVEKFRQRVIRRFFTNPAERLADGTYIPADYIFDTEYGLGATRLIGEPQSDEIASQFRQKVRAAVLIDQSVNSTREPEIQLFAAPSGEVWVRVKAFLLNASEVVISFPLSRNKNP